MQTYLQTEFKCLTINDPEKAIVEQVCDLLRESHKKKNDPFKRAGEIVAGIRRIVRDQRGGGRDMTETMCDQYFLEIVHRRGWAKYLDQAENTSAWSQWAEGFEKTR